MGGFVIIPQKSKYYESIKRSFAKRKFQTPIEFKNSRFDILYYPKYNGVCQFIADSRNNILLIYGTLWYKNKSFEKNKDIILKEINEDILNEDLLSGTFTLVYFNEKNDNIKIIHDTHAVNRIYYDKTTKIISSSWLSLVWQKKRAKNDINTNAVLENLILGFNIGNKTFINSIERIKSGINLDKNVTYKRLRNKIIKKHNKQNYCDSIDSSINKFKNTLDPKLIDFDKILLGVSGGHDSRLMLGAFDKDFLDNKLSLFTFYKPDDKDLEIAKTIAEKLNKGIEIIKTKKKDSHKELEKIYDSAFNFFDGQCGTMLQYSKEDYTKEFRDKLLNKSNMHLSGVGGEIFRNYNHQPKTPLPWKFWIDHYFCSGKLTQLIDNDDLMDELIDEFKLILGLKSKKIKFIDRKRFYGQFFLSDWHGIRNSIENQYSNYYSPFTDVELINYSYQTIKYHSSGGEFESRMINELSPKLARIKSEYGYNFSHIPTKTKLVNRIKSLVKLPILSPIRKLKSNKNKSVQIGGFEEEIFENLKNVFNYVKADFDLFLLLKKEQTLMISYLFKKIID
jgi:hypothetical protein